MNDYTTLWSSVALVLFFFVCGILDMLDNLVIKILLISGFVAIFVNILIQQSKKDDAQKNPPK